MVSLTNPYSNRHSISAMCYTVTTGPLVLDTVKVVALGTTSINGLAYNYASPSFFRGTDLYISRREVDG